MSDRVALNGRSMHDEHTCDRNTREPLLNRAQARLAPKLPVFESRCMHERSCRRASLTITHNNQTTYQTIHFKHNNTNTWAKTVPEINSNRISPTARTTVRTAPSCQILHGWYTSQPTRQSCTSMDSCHHHHHGPSIIIRVRKSIQKWILYHAIRDPIEFWLYWDPTDPYDIKLLQEYVGSNGSVVYLPSSTIESLISLWNHMNLLINKGKSVDQKCNAQYFFQDDQWFNLTAHDMKRTLVNAGMKYHRPQVIHGTSLPNSTSPPSPAPMKSSIHLELTPCDSTSTTTSMYKTCLLNTPCDHQLHLDHTNTSPELQDHSIGGHAETESILDSEDLLQLDSISVSPQATCNFETESLPEFKGQLDDINQEPTDTPSTIPTAFQAPRDDTYNPECTHNPMAIQCNQYPNPSHNSALPQFLAHHNCEDLDPIDTPSAVPTALQAPKHCTHNPSTSQVKKSDHTNPMALPYPPDPGEHVMERSATPTALVERDKLDPSSLAPPKGVMESSFSWTYLFKSPTSSTLCFGEPTLRKLTQVELLCNPISSTKHTSHVSRVSDCHSSLVTTPSSRLILDKPKIEVTKALIHHIGKNGEYFYGENFIYDFPESLKHIMEADWGDKLKLNYTTFGHMLMEIDWGGKPNYTSYGCPMANWKGHKTQNPNHMNESLLSEVDSGST